MKALTTEDGGFNCHNNDSCELKNQHVTKKRYFQRKFKINMWGVSFNLKRQNPEIQLLICQIKFLLMSLWMDINYSFQ